MVSFVGFKGKPKIEVVKSDMRFEDNLTWETNSDQYRSRYLSEMFDSSKG